MKRRICACLMFILLMAPTLLRAEDQGRKLWAATFYGGTMADADKGTLGDVLTGAKYSGENNMAMAALSRELYRYERLSFEVEGQFGNHWGDNDYYETVGAGYARFYLPLDKYLRTSIAFGVGLSYTTEIPAVEYRKDQRVSKLLGYLGAELAIGLPSISQWDLVCRLHHRSGAKGVIGYGESNYICAGVKFKF